MDNMPEREQPKAERVIRLGEEFHPFDPRYVRPYVYEYERVPYAQRRELESGSSIVLNIEEGVKIPISVNAAVCPVTKGDALTPFKRESGYQIDSEDLNLETRIRKVKRLHDVLSKYMDSKNFHFVYLYVATQIKNERSPQQTAGYQRSNLS